jgi:hypothetical protein
MTAHEPYTRPMFPDAPPQAPPPGPVTAWESIPKFIRFSVWVYAVLTVVGLAIWPIMILAVLAL